MAQKAEKGTLDKFSGLGVPTSFQKKIHENSEDYEQLVRLEEVYAQLCRGEEVQVHFNDMFFYMIKYFFIQNVTIQLSE